MPSIRKVKNWYAQSFEELINFPPLSLSPVAKQSLNELLTASPATSGSGQPQSLFLPPSIPNPAIIHQQMDAEDMGAWAFGGGGNKRPYGEGVPYRYGECDTEAGGNAQDKDKGSAGARKNASGNTSVRNGGIKLRAPIERRYYAHTPSHLYPPEVHDYNERFTRALDAIKKRHDPTVATVAQGVLEWQRDQGVKSGSGVDLTGNGLGGMNGGGEVQTWLDRFYMSRIGIRFLIGQHVALNVQQPHKDYVGIICTKAVLTSTRQSVHDIVQEAIENARFVCEEHYALLRGPPVQLICPRDLTFAYVPGHLSHIVFELLKNSLRAVVERFGADAEDRGVAYPPIKVIVVEGSEDITIKISDEGGGIPRRAVPLVWTYMYTTMGGQSIDKDYHAGDFQAPMAGFGYGLPLSRLVSSLMSSGLCADSLFPAASPIAIKLTNIINNISATMFPVDQLQTPLK
ncbi:hypothetical protein ID866_332, partial [Astraeus odoratus]